MPEPPVKKPSRTSKLFWTDYAAFIYVIASIVTGIVLWLCLDKGPGGQKSFWGWHRHEWGDLHLYFSLAFTALFLLHFYQHWCWVLKMTPRQLCEGQYVKGLGRLVVITAINLGVVFGIFYLLRDSADYQSVGRGRGPWREREISNGVAPGAQDAGGPAGYSNDPKQSNRPGPVHRRYHGGRGDALDRP